MVKKEIKLKFKNIGFSIILLIAVVLYCSYTVISSSPSPPNLLGNATIKVAGQELQSDTNKYNFSNSSYSYYSKQVIAPTFKAYFRNNSNTAESVRFEKDGYFFIYDQIPSSN